MKKMILSGLLTLTLASHNALACGGSGEIPVVDEIIELDKITYFNLGYTFFLGHFAQVVEDSCVKARDVTGEELSAALSQQNLTEAPAGTRLVRLARQADCADLNGQFSLLISFNESPPDATSARLIKSWRYSSLVAAALMDHRCNKAFVTQP